MTDSTGTRDKPLVTHSFDVQAGSVEVAGESEPQPVVFCGIRTVPIEAAHLDNPDLTEHFLLIRADHARRIAHALLEAANSISK